METLRIVSAAELAICFAAWLGYIALWSKRTRTPALHLLLVVSAGVAAWFLGVFLGMGAENPGLWGCILIVTDAILLGREDERFPLGCFAGVAVALLMVGVMLAFYTSLGPVQRAFLWGSMLQLCLIMSVIPPVFEITRLNSERDRSDGYAV